jgi:gamma-glutamylcysteine synthetase
MPQRLIKPQWWWQKISSPITLKSFLLFLAIIFIGYTVVRDENQRRASFERYKAISQYTEESRVALESVKQQNEIAKQAQENTVKIISFMDELNQGMRDVAEILRINREAQYIEHEQILRRARPPQRSKKKVSQQGPCYEWRPVEKKFGDTSVMTRIYTEIPCK